jgi:hypothetical protein
MLYECCMTVLKVSDAANDVAGPQVTIEEANDFRIGSNRHKVLALPIEKGYHVTFYHIKISA